MKKGFAFFALFFLVFSFAHSEEPKFYYGNYSVMVAYIESCSESDYEYWVEKDRREQPKKYSKETNGTILRFITKLSKSQEEAIEAALDMYDVQKGEHYIVGLTKRYSYQSNFIMLFHVYIAKANNETYDYRWDNVLNAER